MIQPIEQFDGQRNSADVIIIDGLPPEEGAMSQAVYSRKPKSILFQLLQVLKKGAQSFMEVFYSGYGHNSIGDCGSTTLYLENVSMLAAKAFQDWSLYKGQEASTRYLDFGGRIMINPLDGQLLANHLYIARDMLNEKSLEKIAELFVATIPESIGNDPGCRGAYIQNKWMAFYDTHMPIVKMHVASLNPKDKDQDQTTYDKAVNARAFDIMRAFIPAGMTTLVSWHSDLRQLRDHLAILKYHPADEIARVAKTAIIGLEKTYPASFVQKKSYPETETYLQKRAEHTSYFDDGSNLESENFGITNIHKLDLKCLQQEYGWFLENRPPKTELPHEIGEAGTVNVHFKIDFGSFRDAQRHRKGVCKMPLLTTRYGFHQWYLDRLPEESRIEAIALMDELVPLINELPCSKEDKQYYIPMGFIVLADFTWTFDQLVYVAELRSSETVHATFRVHAQSIGKWIEEYVPTTKLYVDYSEDKWSYKRGTQDIVEKK